MFGFVIPGWVKLAAAGVVVGSFLGAGAYIHHLGTVVASQEKTITSKEETIVGLRADVLERDLNITDLKASRDTVNDRMRMLIDDNNDRVAAEVARRKQVAAERDRSRAALQIALDTIATVSAQDETFKNWLAQPVPAAAWDRLRAAAE